MAQASRAMRRVATRLSVDDRTDDIMVSARAVIAEKGYENVLMSDIAERAGIVEGTLYRYFKNKRDLLTKVAEVWFREQLSEDSQLDAIPGTKNKLRYLASRTLLVIRREPVLARYMLTELRPDPGYRESVFFALNRRLTEDVVTVCRDAIAKGEFRDDVDVATLRDMLFGCIEHRTWAFLRGEGHFSVEHVADSIATVIYRGMAAEAPAAAANSNPLSDVTARLEKVVAALEARLAVLP